MIFGTDLHCDSKPCLFFHYSKWRTGDRDEFTQHSEPKAIGTKHKRKKRESLPGRTSLGPFFFCWKVPFLIQRGPFYWDAHLSMPDSLPDPRAQTGWSCANKKLNPLAGWNGPLQSLSNPSYPTCSCLLLAYTAQWARDGIKSPQHSTFPRKTLEPPNLHPPLQKMRLAADQTSIILYCNKLFECVYSYFLQSFHFVFNINGLSQIQKIIVMFIFNILQWYSFVFTYKYTNMIKPF